MTGLGDAVERDPKREPVPYYRYAFHNLYNYALMGGIGAASLLTGDWALGLLGAGLEMLWMVYAPDSRLLRRLWFDRLHGAELEAAAAAERGRLLASLPPGDRSRLEALEEKRDQIVRLAAENQAIGTDLLRDELAKVRKLGASFADLVVTARRYREYLDSVDFDALERELREQTRRAGGKVVEPAASGRSNRIEGLPELAQKNLAVLMKRREKLSEIREYVSQAEAQMALIENTFRLLADQIVTMRSPKELGGQLDELIDGVEVVRSTAREAEALLEVAR